MEKEARRQYYELMILLNKGNKTINEKTTLEFFIKDDGLFACLASGTKIQLCYRNHRGTWSPANFTKFLDLETFISKALYEVENDLNVTKIILLRLFM